MYGKLRSSLSCLLAFGAFFAITATTQAQCHGSRSTGSQSSAMQNSGLQAYALQQYALMQQYAMQRQLASNQIYAQQLANQQKAATEAALKRKQKAAVVAKDPAPIAEPRAKAPAAEPELVDDERLASSSLNLVRPLAADPEKRVFAKLQLRRLIDSYPNTVAAGEAGELLKRIP